MRILVTGARGRLGAALVRTWAVRHEITALGRHDCDLSDPTTAAAAVAAHQFDALVQCAALTNVDYCETHAAEADTVNGEAPGRLAELCALRGVRMIHIGTDYVFDGEKSSPYTEDDTPNPISAYGASKWLGDRAVLAASPRHIVARVSWVFGPDRASFVDQIVQRATREERVAAIADKWSSPAYTLDLADWLEHLLDPSATPGGIVHLCNAGTTTWRDYGQHALDTAAAAGVPLKTRVVEPLAIADMKAFVARRPVRSALDTARFTAWTGVKPRPWQEAVEEHIRATSN